MVKNYSIRYFNEIKTILDNIDLALIEKVIALLLKAYQSENHVFFMGNGGSASTASHFVCDINKGVCTSLSKKFKAICLNDNMPLIMAYSNDLSYDNVFVEQMKNYLGPDDVVIGISCSGNSKNVLKAIEYANDKKAITVGFTSFDGGLLAKKAQFVINARVNDMQKSEDVHLIISHLIMQILIERLNEMDFG